MKQAQIQQRRAKWREGSAAAGIAIILLAVLLAASVVAAARMAPVFKVVPTSVETPSIGE